MIIQSKNLSYTIIKVKAPKRIKAPPQYLTNLANSIEFNLPIKFVGKMYFQQNIAKMY